MPDMVELEWESFCKKLREHQDHNIVAVRYKGIQGYSCCQVQGIQGYSCCQVQGDTRIKLLSDTIQINSEKYSFNINSDFRKLYVDTKV